MTLPIIWVLVGIGALIIELISPHFGFVFVSLAAFASATANGFGLSASWQLGTFAVASFLLLTLVRPRLVSKLGAQGVPSRTDTLIGKMGRVTEATDPELGTGRVVVAGQDWAARSRSPLPVGARIRVHGADGIVLEVEASSLESGPE